MIDIEITQMLTPGKFFVREIPGPNCSREVLQFQELQSKLVQYYESDTAAKPKAVTPMTNQIYCAKHNDVWHRVLVQHVLQRATGPHASCMLLDSGQENVLIPSRNFRPMCDEFLQIPYQKKHCVLYGIEPISYAKNSVTDCNWSLQPYEKWDVSAETFMADVIAEYSGWKIAIMEADKSKRHYLARLFAIDKSNVEICINDLLVQKKYAAYTAQPPVAKSCDGPKTPERTKEEDMQEAIYGKDLSSPGTSSEACSPQRWKQSPRVGKGRASLLREKLMATNYGSASTTAPGAGRQLGCSSNSEPESTDIKPVLPCISRLPRHIQSMACSAPIADFLNISDTIAPKATDVSMLQPQQASDVNLDSNGYISSRLKNACMTADKISVATPAGHDVMASIFVSASSASGSERDKVDDFIRKPTVTFSDPSGIRTAEDMNIFVDGGFSPRCEVNLLAQPFAELIANTPYLQDIKRPSTLQSFVWPIVLAGTDVVGIAPSSKPSYRGDSGKTLGYLLPLTTQLRHKSSYRNLPESSIGPFVVILCPSWRCVAEVYHQCDKIFKSQRLDIGLLYGAGQEENQQIKLLQGCDILIATPACLIRTLDKDCTTLNRLSHLILEDADVLTAQHADQLKEFMSRWQLELKQRGNKTAPQQVLQFSPRWVPAISQFATDYQNATCFVITSKIEAAYYGRVRQVAIMCKKDERLKTIVDTLESKPGKVVIFTSRDVDARDIYNVEFRTEYSDEHHNHIPTHQNNTSLPGFTERPCQGLGTAQPMGGVYGPIAQPGTKKVACGRVGSHGGSDYNDNELDMILRSCAKSSVLLGNADLDSEQLALVNQEWMRSHKSSDSQPILVLTDAELNEFTIRDASWIIHYSIPSEQKVFASRLWTLRSKFITQDNLTTRKLDECVSFLLITEECQAMASRLLKVLRRSGQETPASLLKMADTFTEQTEKKKHSDLCPYMKSFGKCRRFNVCEKRHKICTSLDTPGVSTRYMHLPSEGEVKVKITYVDDASRYYAFLLEHHDTAGKVTSLSADNKRLCMELAFYYAHENCRKPALVAADNTRQLFAWGDLNHGFNRVELLQVLSSVPSDLPDRAKIFLVDVGETREVPLSQLFDLPKIYADVPYQAVEIFICRVQPVDKDNEWTDKASTFVAEAIQDKELHGNIVLSMSNTLWLDPLLEREWLPHLKICNDKPSVRSVLLERHLAVENPEHMDLLYAACEGAFLLPVSFIYSRNPNRAYTGRGQLIKTKTEVLPEGSDVVDVIVSAVDTIDLFYVQLANHTGLLTQLREAINRHIALHGVTGDEFVIREGLVVLAQFSDDNWYRGKVVSYQDDIIEVFFVDYGETEEIPKSHIMPLPRELRQTPFQAIECSLVDIEIVDESQARGACADELMAQTGVSTGSEKVLQASVVRKSDARYTGVHRYGITLFDVITHDYDINISAELVKSGYTRLSSTKLESLFPAPDASDNLNSFSRLSQLCKQLLQTTDSVVLQKHAKDLICLVHEVCSNRSFCDKATFDIVENVSSMLHSSNSMNTDRTGFIYAIALTLSYISDIATAQALLESLKWLKEGNDLHCQEMEKMGNWNIFCQVLDQRDKNLLLEDILWSLQGFVNCHRCCLNLIDFGALKSLAYILGNASNKHVVGTTGEIIRDMILTACYGDIDATHKVTTGQVECLYVGIQQLLSDDIDLVFNCILSIEGLLDTKSIKMDDVRKFNGAAIVCQSLEKWTDNKLLHHGIDLLSKFAAKDCYNKSANSRIHATLQNLCNRSTLIDKNRELCKELLTKLQVPLECIKGDDILSAATSAGGGDGVISNGVSSSAGRCNEVRTQSLSNHPIPKNEFLVIHKERYPEIRWSQSPWNVLLEVDVKDVQRSTDLVQFEETSVHFSTVVLSVRYTFHLELKESIVPLRCDFSVQSGRVYVGLKKLKRGIWPRLLRIKLSYPNLSVDHARWAAGADSDDEDDNGTIGCVETEDQSGSPLDLIRLGESCWNVGFPNCNTAAADDDNKASQPVPHGSDFNSDTEDEEKFLDSDSDPDSDPALGVDRSLGYHHV